MGSEYMIAVDVEIEGRDGELLFKIEDLLTSVLAEHMKEAEWGLQGKYDDRSLYLTYRGNVTDGQAEDIKFEVGEVIKQFKDRLSSAEIRMLDLEYDGDKEDLLKESD